MDHAHEDRSIYYLEQLCSIGLAGMFALVAFLLWSSDQLENILNSWFYLPMLWTSIALAALVLVRAVGVWLSVGRPDAGQHHCDDDDCCHHDGHEQCHDTGSATASGNHDHGHEHGWAPWRYVVLLIPIMFFFLFPPQALWPVKGADMSQLEETGNVKATQFQITDKTLTTLRELAVPETVLGNLLRVKDRPFGTQEEFSSGLAGLLTKDEVKLWQPLVLTHATVESIDLDFLELQRAAFSSATRDYFTGKKGRLKGQFVIGPNNRDFTLALQDDLLLRRRHPAQRGHLFAQRHRQHPAISGEVG